MKISKKQLRKIIKEEKAKLVKERAPAGFHGGQFSIFDPNYIYNLLAEEAESYLQSSGDDQLRPVEFDEMREAVMAALDKVQAGLVSGQ